MLVSRFVIPRCFVRVDAASSAAARSSRGPPAIRIGYADDVRPGELVMSGDFVFLYTCLLYFMCSKYLSIMCCMHWCIAVIGMPSCYCLVIVRNL
jgi:hypothetical protein